MAIVIRWYRILEILVAKGRVPLEEIRSELNVSLSTLQKSIEQLNEILDEGMEIRQEDGCVVLEVNDYDQLEEILSGSLRKESDFNSASKRAAYISKRLIQSQEPLFIDDLAEEVGVSRTTINKDLRHVKELAAEYGILVTGKPNRGLEVTGTELQLRLFYLHIVYAYFDSESLEQETLHFLTHLYETYKIPRKTQDLLHRVVAVTIARLKRGQQMECPIPYFVNELTDSSIMAELVYHLESTYQLSLSHYEQDFLSFPLSTQYVDGLDYHNQKNEELHLIFKKMMQSVKETVNVHVNEEGLYAEMQNHLKFLLNRLIFRVQANDIFQGEIKQKYPLAFEMARVAGQELSNIFHCPMELSEISYLALYFELILRESEQESILLPRKIAVVCTTGRGTANMICRQLSRVLGQDIEITQYSEENFSPDHDDNYFAIFTTIPLKLGHLQSPVIHLTNLFDDQWLREEWQKVHRYHQNNLETIVLKFARFSPSESYTSCLSKMTQSLFEEGLVDSGFGQRVLEREEKQTTIFGSGIGFPHTVNQLKNKTVLMVGVIEPTDSEVERPVDFIFLVAIPEQIELKMETELLELYDDIFRIASDDSLKLALRQVQTESELLALSKEKGVF